MAEHAHAGPVELGAPMDYAAHRSTFLDDLGDVLGVPTFSDPELFRAGTTGHEHQ